jgi:hypothetical protein
MPLPSWTTNIFFCHSIACSIAMLDILIHLLLIIKELGAEFTFAPWSHSRMIWKLFSRPFKVDFTFFGASLVQYEPNGNVNNFTLITKHTWMKRPTIFPKRLKRPKRPGLVTYGLWDMLIKNSVKCLQNENMYWPCIPGQVKQIASRILKSTGRHLKIGCYTRTAKHKKKLLKLWFKFQTQTVKLKNTFLGAGGSGKKIKLP